MRLQIVNSTRVLLRLRREVPLSKQITGRYKINEYVLVCGIIKYTANVNFYGKHKVVKVELLNKNRSRMRSYGGTIKKFIQQGADKRLAFELKPHNRGFDSRGFADRVFDTNREQKELKGRIADLPLFAGQQ